MIIQKCSQNVVALSWYWECLIRTGLQGIFKVQSKCRNYKFQKEAKITFLRELQSLIFTRLIAGFKMYFQSAVKMQDFKMQCTLNALSHFEQSLLTSGTQGRFKMQSGLKCSCTLKIPAIPLFIRATRELQNAGFCLYINIYGRLLKVCSKNIFSSASWNGQLKIL